MGVYSTYNRSVGVLGAGMFIFSLSTTKVEAKNLTQDFAKLVACGLAPETPTESDKAFDKFKEQFGGVVLDPIADSTRAPTNWECSKWIMGALGNRYDQEKYCSILAKDLGPVSSTGRGLSSSSLSGGGDEDETNEREPSCKDLSDKDGFAACVTLRQRAAERAAARSGPEVKRFCENLGINMDLPRTTGRRTMTSYERSGVVGSGNPCVGGGGLTLVKEPAWATVLKTGLGFWNAQTALKVMKDGAHDAQVTARLGLNYNHDLGFPNQTTSGSQAGLYGNNGYGSLYGQQFGCSGGAVGIYGQGGCNGGQYYGNISNTGGYYSGYGGGCPTGACYGGGGIVVGGNVGGVCGIPPYTSNGCGGGGYPVPYGGGYPQPAAYGYGAQYGGQQGYPYMYGQGGQYGYNPSQYNNGYMNGQYPYGQQGQYGYNGQYGQAPYYGANNGYNSGYIQQQQQQQQMMQQWQQFQQSYQTKQDRNAAGYARNYQSDLDRIDYLKRDASQQYQGFQGSSAGSYGPNAQPVYGGYAPYQPQCIAGGC